MAVAAGTRRPLTRQRVLQAALRFVDDHGLTALSMHKLGAELGVKGMSLYNHVDGKSGLLDGIVEIIWDEIEAPAEDVGDADWREGVHVLARSLRDLFHRHPKAAPLLMARPALPVLALQLFDHHLRRLQDNGFTPERAAQLIRTVIAYGFGFALAELAWMEPADQDDDELRRYRHVNGIIPPNAPDHLVRTALLLCTGCDMDAQFDLGVDLMLSGLEAAESAQTTT